MNDRSTWTDADFDEMSWHDCRVNALALDQEGQWQSDLVLDIDYILEWMCGTDKVCRFRIAPAKLRFTRVDNLRLDLALDFKQPLEIDSIQRRDLPAAGQGNYRWTIRIHAGPDATPNVIEFDATGFTQELTGRAIVTAAPSLTGLERKKAQAGWQEHPDTAIPRTLRT